MSKRQTSKDELKILKDHIKGPIIRVEDPRDHEVEDIMASYFRMVLFLARKYTRPTVEYEDLVVEGMMGLLDAINRWDPQKAGENPKAFHNLAIVRIKSRMFTYFLSNNSIYTIPNYMARTISLVEQVRNLIFAREFEGSPEEALRNFQAPELESAFPGELVGRIKELKERIATNAKNSGQTYEDLVASVLEVEQGIEEFEGAEEAGESPEQEAAEREFLQKFLDHLAPQARTVIKMRLEGHTLEQVGDILGFTRERARQIEAKALQFLWRTRMFADAVSDTYGEEED